jgi:hypothetical protein
MAQNPGFKGLGFNRTDLELFRYWSPRAQMYASGDQLMHYLDEDWEPDRVVEVETHWFGEARHIQVYHFVLRRGSNELTMRVIGNPFSHRLVNDARLNFQQVPHRRTVRKVTFDVMKEES